MSADVSRKSFAEKLDRIVSYGCRFFASVMGSLAMFHQSYAEATAFFALAIYIQVAWIAELRD